MPHMNPTRTQRYYHACLAARTAAFAVVLAGALLVPDRFDRDLADGFRILSPLSILWLLLMVSMVFRLFPSKVESLGCQKEFARRYRPTGRAVPPQDIRQANRGALIVALVWIAFNAVFFLGHAKGWLTDRFLVCLAGFYGMSDIICILFFCPFQSWMMHNRCCTTCRIYDWDYLMLCTPLLALQNAMALSACLLAAVIFVRWEVTLLRHPELFFEASNDALRCAACQEHLCQQKRALAAHGRSRRPHTEH